MILEKIIIALAVFFSYFIQSSVEFLRIGGIKPDFLLVVTMYFALYRGEFAGIWLGFASGLLQDLNIGGIATQAGAVKYFVGIHALPKTLVGWLVGKFGPGINKDSTFVIIVLIFFVSLFKGLLSFFLISFFHDSLSGQTFLSIILPEALYTAILGIIWFRLLLWAMPPVEMK